VVVAAVRVETATTALETPPPSIGVAVAVLVMSRVMEKVG
jgi:hypothetical protein